MHEIHTYLYSYLVTSLHVFKITLNTTLHFMGYRLLIVYFLTSSLC